MSGLKTEYEVEKIFINQLNNEQGYSYIDMANYDDVLANFRVQFCKVNAKALIEAKGVAELSDSEFNKVLLRLENHTIYESAKVLREKWVLELDSGKTIYAEFLMPHFEEQQKIADFLSAFDEAINYAKQELDKWKGLKKGLLQQMFV